MGFRDYRAADFEVLDEDDLGDDELRFLADVLRQALHEDYADASDEEMDEALVNVLDSMSPAESWNIASALNQIGSSASHLLSDPTVSAIARSALPVAGAALGTVIGGPAGTALGSQLGTVAAGALPNRPPTGPSAPAGGAPGVTAPPPTVTSAGPSSTPTQAAPPSPAAGGSAAAAQGLVLTQQPQVLQSLLSAALGQYGRQQVGGIPVAQVLGMFSKLMGEAARDADEMMYLDEHGEGAESLFDGSAMESGRSLYTALLDADNLDLTKALG